MHTGALKSLILGDPYDFAMMKYMVTMYGASATHVKCNSSMHHEPLHLYRPKIGKYFPQPVDSDSDGELSDDASVGGTCLA